MVSSRPLTIKHLGEATLGPGPGQWSFTRNVRGYNTTRERQKLHTMDDEILTSKPSSRCTIKVRPAGHRKNLEHHVELTQLNTNYLPMSHQMHLRMHGSLWSEYITCSQTLIKQDFKNGCNPRRQRDTKGPEVSQ